MKTDGSIETITEPIEVATVPLLDMATGAEKLEYALAWAGYSIVPNFQVLWLSDALTQGHVIPAGYLVKVGLYSLLYIALAVSLAIILFQRREVG